MTSQVKRQLWIYRLLLAMCAAIPLVFLWALDVHVPNLRALRESLGTPQRATAMRASLTAAVALLWTVLFQVGFVRPLQAHMEHDRDLQAQLEGTENRITVARNRYIDAVKNYNISVRTFPNNLTAMVMGWKAKANFAVEDEKAISTPPQVRFDAAPAAK